MARLLEDWTASDVSKWLKSSLTLAKYADKELEVCHELFASVVLRACHTLNLSTLARLLHAGAQRCEFNHADR